MFLGVAPARTKPNNRTGRVRIVTDQWRETMVAELVKRGKSQRWLEEQIGAPNGSIQQLMRRNATSRIVDDICRVLEIDLPIDAPSDVMEIIDLYRSKDARGRENAQNSEGARGGVGVDLWIKSNAHLISPIAVSALTKMGEGELLAFKETVNKSKRWVVSGYFAWLLFGLHYAYYGQWGRQILFWLTFGGLGFWWVIDFFRVPSIHKSYYHALTLGAAKDIVALSR